MQSKKWLKITGMAIAFPSTILTVFWGMMYLADMDVISKGLALSLAFLVVGNFLFLMVFYAYKRKG